MSDWFPISTAECRGCTVAADLFQDPDDWITSRIDHRSFLGVNFAQEEFIDLDFAQMLEVLISA